MHEADVLLTRKCHTFLGFDSQHRLSGLCMPRLSFSRCVTARRKQERESMSGSFQYVEVQRIKQPIKQGPTVSGDGAVPAAGPGADPNIAGWCHSQPGGGAAAAC